MGWRFRKSFTVIPGVKLNLTSRGLSATIGQSPASLNIGPAGIYQNLGIPGTGLSRRDRLDSPNPQSGPPRTDLPDHQRPTLPASFHSGATEIRSASTQMLGSDSMKALQDLLCLASTERDAIGLDLAFATKDCRIATDVYKKWDRGFLFKRLMKGSFNQRRERSETAQAKVDELQEQLRLTTIEAEIDVDKQQAEPYYRMRDEFSALSECAKIWDTLSERQVDRVRERSGATREVTRDTVKFDLSASDLIRWEKTVPHAANKNGGDLYIYPGFLLYRASKQAFALIDITEVDLHFDPHQFIEAEPIPPDARIVGSSWLKCNKDGSPDRRFRNNVQLPVALYGELTFSSSGGLREEFQASDVGKAERFARAWKLFRDSIAGVSGAEGAN